MSKQELRPDPRLEAARIIERIFREDAYANRLLDAAAQNHHFDPRDRALLTELVYGVLRHLQQIDHALDRMSNHGIRSIDIAILPHLRVAVYQMLFLDRIPAHAIVFAAVEAVRTLRGPKVAGFANALLRRLGREYEEDRQALFRPHPFHDIVEQLALSESHPAWLVERYLKQFGMERTMARLRFNNQAAPLTLRIHPAFGSRDTFIDALRRLDIQAVPTTYSVDGIRLQASGHPISLASLISQFPNAFIVQDEAAQIIARWLAPQAGERILDACAAPGGKATHLSALAPSAHILALDIHPHKIALICQHADRLHITNLTARQGDATAPLDETYDRILLDAPCSGLGTLRKHPEIRYRRSLKQISEMADLQRKMLDNLASAVRVDGILLYAVCTDTPEESDAIIDSFLQTHPNFVLDSSEMPDASWAKLIDERGILRTNPEYHDEMDAFFAARLRRKV